MSRIAGWFTEEDTIGIQDNAILDQWEVPFGAWIDQMVDWIDANLVWLLVGLCRVSSSTSGHHG